MIESGQYQRNTGRLPDWYIKQPPSERGDATFFAAWGALGTCRQFTPSGDGWGPIPWDRALLYARELGFSRRYRAWFASVILALDSKHREHVRDERAKERKKTEKQQAREAKMKSKDFRAIGRG